MQIHMNKNRSIVEGVNSLQNAGKVSSITLNIQESFYPAFTIRESLGKLLQSGKARESFLSFVYQERFQKQQERFCQTLSKSGKAFKNSGKGFFPKFPKITLGKERERKAFSPSGAVLQSTLLVDFRVYSKTSAQIRSDRIRREQIGSDRIRQDQIGSDRMRQDQIGSDRIRQDQIGSDNMKIHENLEKFIKIINKT